MSETPNLDEVLAYFCPGPRARECGDGGKADIYEAAKAELAALKRPAPEPASGEFADAVALVDSMLTTNAWENDEGLHYISRGQLKRIRAALDAAHVPASPVTVPSVSLEECENTAEHKGGMPC